MNKLNLVALVAIASLVVAAGASASTYAPQKPTTVQMHGVPCSVTERGPVFTFTRKSGIVMTYGGGVSCAGGAGQKSLTICAQVENGSRFFTITGSCLAQGPTPVNPLRLHTGRSAFLGHGYRIKASGTVEYPGFGGTARSAVAYSKTWAP